MISYIDDLYVTEKTGRRQARILKAINDNKVLFKGYIVILSLTENDVFDIIPHYTVKSLVEKDIDIKVLGIAENKDAAMMLCKEMTEDYIESRSEKSMRSYFEYK